MPASASETLLGSYHYDPLDRLLDCTPSKQAAIHRYYCQTRLATEIQGAAQRSIVQHDDQLLAQQHRRDGIELTATLLATDQQRSVLNALDANQPHALAYTPYGHRPLENGLLSLLGFNGERPDPVTGHYHLGNGYRQYNPVMMRFNSPDSWSPFGDGGLNAYAYCEGDPINQADPTGHSPFKFVAKAVNKLSKISKKSRTISKSSARKGAVKRKHDINAVIAEINEKDPIASITGAYTSRSELTDINQTHLLYQHAQRAYPFITVRRPNIQPVNIPDTRKPTWINTNNTRQLDVSSFDISIANFRNGAAQLEKLSLGRGRDWSSLADELEIIRADHIRRNTGIKLYEKKKTFPIWSIIRLTV